MRTVSVEAEIDNAVSRLGFADQEFVKCLPETAQFVIGTAKQKFVYDNPRAWWLALKYEPAVVTHFPDSDGFNHLTAFFPSGTDSCWFIPETDMNPRPVYEAKASAIVPVLRECYGFEYNVVSKSYDWLIIENDHNVVLRVDAPGEQDGASR